MTMFEIIFNIIVGIPLCIALFAVVVGFTIGPFIGLYGFIRDCMGGN